MNEAKIKSPHNLLLAFSFEQTVDLVAGEVGRADYVVDLE